MRPESLKYLEDMRLAAEAILRFTSGRDWTSYSADEQLRSAVERQFLIIGEALNRLDKSEPATAAGISAKRQIIAFRNILVHGYDVIDDHVVWNVVTADLPVLRTEVLALLAAGPATAGDPTENNGNGP